MLKKIVIEGMSCKHCVAHVEKALLGLKESKEVEVNLEGKYATVNTEASDEEIRDSLDDAGYDVVTIESI